METASDGYPPLPGYDVLSELGSGGFGQVLLARHQMLGRLVAVKQIHAAALADEDAVARFRREALALARLEHPAVVAVYDLRLTATSAIMLMEYVPGESLREALDRRVISAPVAIGILADVADALAAAAAVGIVHRDVKPANVFLVAGGRAKLGDFGISRIADANVFRTRAGVLTGTPAYLAPETMTAEYEPDSHSDDYAFAVMAHEMLVGQRPFDGDGLALLGQHGFVIPDSPMQLVAGFPAAAAEALLAGLEKDPARRMSAGELVARLRSIPESAWPPPPAPVVHGQPSTATVLGKSAPLGTIPVLPGGDNGRPAAHRPRRRRRTRLAVVLIAVLVAIAVAAAVALVNRDTAGLSVRGATVSVDNSQGNCPSATYLFTASIDTNGAAGTLRLRWLQPNGELTAETDLDVVAGQDRVTASLQFDVTGSAALNGSARLEVLAPQALTAAPIDIGYSCP